MRTAAALFPVLGAWVVMGCRSLAPAADLALRVEAVEVLRSGLKCGEFWPSMHAAEGMTRAGLAQDVKTALLPQWATETDDQRRCGLARELVRAGADEPSRVFVDILRDPESNGHTHACESLFKIGRIGDRKEVFQAMLRGDPVLEIMAAAALVLDGDPRPLARVRAHVSHPDVRVRRTAVWVLGQLGNRRDLPALRALAAAESDRLARAFCWNAMALLGDEEARPIVVTDLRDPDHTVRTYAAQGVGEWGGAEHLPLLREVLRDPHVDARIRAAEAIVRILKRP